MPFMIPISQATVHHQATVLRVEQCQNPSTIPFPDTCSGLSLCRLLYCESLGASLWVSPISLFSTYPHAHARPVLDIMTLLI